MKKLIYSIDLFPAPIGITNGVLTLARADNSVVDRMVEAHHYSHKSTKNRFLSMVVNGNMGFIQLGYGIRPQNKNTISPLIKRGNYCEFDRMWLADELPKNSESQVIALLLSYVKQLYPRIKFIITYADGSVGNKGIIYQATNAIPIGQIPCDFYVLPSGERIHPVSMYHRHGTRAQETLDRIYPGIKHIKGEAFQYRYLYILNHKMRAKFQERNAVPNGGGGAVPPARYNFQSNQEA